MFRVLRLQTFAWNERRLAGSRLHNLERIQEPRIRRTSVCLDGTATVSAPRFTRRTGAMSDDGKFVVPADRSDVRSSTSRRINRRRLTQGAIGLGLSTVTAPSFLSASRAYAQDEPE